jgi:carboxypeptidase Taq
MAAAQLFDAACRAEPAILPSLSTGDFKPLRAWLRANVHAKGSLLSTDELLQAATGQPLTSEMYQRHLRRRYLGTSA